MYNEVFTSLLFMHLLSLAYTLTVRKEIPDKDMA